MAGYATTSDESYRGRSRTELVVRTMRLRLMGATGLQSELARV